MKRETSARAAQPQAIDAIGREIALRRGCNILMPILTPTKYREHYTLYEGKPCISDTADECQKVRLWSQGPLV
jgi:hypothetical protein